MKLIVRQDTLESVLSSIFPAEKVIKNARKEASLINPLTGECLEIDVWFPELRLGFEYQDEYHYQSVYYSHIPLSAVQKTDGVKSDLLLQQGETLILVPCWWDATQTSLEATIQFHRPELLHDTQNAEAMIPLNPPFDFFSVPSVSANMQLMAASFPSSTEMLEVTERNPWWLGEKYDGVRCFWNPRTKHLYSRYGLPIDIHPSVNKLLGRIVFDGEIWCGRGLFLESQILIQSTVEKMNWTLFRVVSFDEASQQMSHQPFERRYALVLSHFPADHPTVILASRFLCKTHLTLSHCIQKVVQGGGEGIILRKPRSMYHFGRSASLLKIKASRGDQEALVVAVEEDGSLFLQMPDGTNFMVPKSDCVLHKRAVRGDIVTFTHDFSQRRLTLDYLERRAALAVGTHDADAHDPAQMQKDAALPAQENAFFGTPSRPVVYRIREDLSWEDVVRNSSLPVRHFMNEQQQGMEGYMKKQRGYWHYDRGKNMRTHLENLARQSGFDPLVAKNWYPITRQEFVQHREVRSILIYYKGSLTRALLDLFPELNLDVSQFATIPFHFWDAAKKRRELYEKFAYTKGGNPLDPEFWYTQSSMEICKFKGGRTVMEYYDSYIDSVVHIFPELHFEKEKFSHRMVRPWLKEENRKAFFDKFAATRGFDPLVAANWYNVTAREMDQRGFDGIMRYYGKLSDCLMQLYPNIGLEKSKFNISQQWQSKENRRSVLLSFAKVHSIDPLVPDNWYPMTLSTFEALEETRSMIFFYGRKYVSALVDLLPEVKFDLSKFKSGQNKRKSASPK